MRLIFVFLAIAFWYAIEPQNGFSQTWTPKASIPPTTVQGRWGAICFSVNGKVYVGGGYVGNFTSLNDLWEYNPVTNAWTAKANMPGAVTSRSASITFTIGGNAYLGLGGQNYPGGSALGDLWEYNASTDTWSPKASIPTGGRTDASCFVANGKAYVVGGITNWGPFAATAETWEYDPATNVWTAKAPFPTFYVYRAAAFSVANKGYVVGGLMKVVTGGSDITARSTYQFDPIANTWTAKADLPDTGKQGLVAFELGGTGYAGLGDGKGNLYYNSFYSYNPTTNIWSGVTASMPPRAFGVAVAESSTKAYVGAGESSDVSGTVTTFYNDWYEFSVSPNATEQPKSLSNDNIILYPNPGNDFIQLKSSLQLNRLPYELIDNCGTIIGTGKLDVTRTINIGSLSKGDYWLRMFNGEKTQTIHFIKL